MSTIMRKPRTVRPATGTACLILVINDTFYQVARLRPDPEVASAAWRLAKGDDAVYDVALMPHGPMCSCPDFTFNRDGKDPAGCKHVKALRAWGLLPGMMASESRPETGAGGVYTEAF